MIPVKWKEYFSFGNKSLAYAWQIILGCTVVWWTLYLLHDDRKVWALISVIIVTEPQIDDLRKATFSRIINTLSGCAIGLAFIYIAHINFWSLVGAITVSVLISTSFKLYPASWKLAPVTVAIIMVPSILEHSTWHEAMIYSFQRTGEILFGTLVAFLLGTLFNRLRRNNVPI